MMSDKTPEEKPACEISGLNQQTRSSEEPGIDLKGENEYLFQAIFEQVAVGMAFISTDGKWLKVNQKLSGIFGYSEEKLLASNFIKIRHPDDESENLEKIIHCLPARKISSG